jgi:hypothetical protein
MSDYSGTGDARMILRTLHLYAQLPQTDNYADCDPSITEQVAALVLVTERLYACFLEGQYSGSNRPWLPITQLRDGVILSERDLIQLILDRPQDAERIAAVIIDRQTTDMGLIRSVLDSSAKSLSNGLI